jgi:hypothetical protein
MPGENVIKGAFSGLVATVPMTVVMKMFQRNAHPGHRVAPSEVVRRAARVLHLRRDTENKHKAAAGVAHFAFGAASGSGFGLAGPARNPVLKGVLYGVSVYAASYLGYLPGMRLMPKPHHDSKGRQVATFASHVVWGAVLGLTFKVLADGWNGSKPPGWWEN